MVFLYQHHGDLGSLRATIKVRGGGEETPLSAVRPCDMGVNEALDMSGILHLIIIYLLKSEHEGLGF